MFTYFPGNVFDHLVGDIEFQWTVEQQMSSMEGRREMMMVKSLVERTQSLSEDQT
jgi:hypothetical protein